MKILILFLISALNLVLWFENVQSILETVFLLPLLSIVFSVIFVWPRISKGKIEIKIIYFVLFGIIYFNAPLYFEAIFNSQELLELISRLRISQNVFIKSNLLLGISLPLISAGYLKAINPNTGLMTSSKRKLSKINITPFVYLSIIFLFLSVSITGLTIGSTYRGASSYYYILVIRAVLITATLIVYNNIAGYNPLTSGKIELKKSNYFHFTVIFLFIVYVLIGGDRGPALTVMSILIFGYILMNNMKVKFKNFIYGSILIILISTVFSFIEVLRRFDVETFSLNVIDNAMVAYDDFESIPGITIRCTSLAIEGIENNLYPHTYGFFLVQSIIKGIPFLGNLLINTLVDENSILANGSANLLSIQHHGVGYTSGIGTSYLADTYIEFGLIGVILVSFLYGIMIGRFENKCRTMSFRNFPELLIVFLFVGYSFYTGRSTLWSFLVNFLHTWILFSVIKYIFINTIKR